MKVSFCKTFIIDKFIILWYYIIIQFKNNNKKYSVGFIVEYCSLYFYAYGNYDSKRQES